MQTKLIENEDDKQYRCCPLWQTRINIVWYRGTSDKDVDVILIGEAPGKDEDLTGKPFVGRSGRLLDKWIEDAELENYAIINIVKCRPPNNRKPSQYEIKACLPYLESQIYAMNPKLLVALGAVPSSVLINKKEVVANIGKIFRSKYGPVMVFPHPSFIIRGSDVYVPIKELKETIEKIKQWRE